MLLEPSLLTGGRLQLQGLGHSVLDLQGRARRALVDGGQHFRQGGGLVRSQGAEGYRTDPALLLDEQDQGPGEALQLRLRGVGEDQFPPGGIRDLGLASLNLDQL